MREETATTPFESIESAHEYVKLLCEEIVVSRASLDADIEQAARERASRRLDALRVAAYKLERLQHHTQMSRRLLNDLRSLRRLLLGERIPGEGLP
jgi:transcription termination factor NusB